jgi:radical SAM superfamily enzyme YgiQ (UPF0313 family)
MKLLLLYPHSREELIGYGDLGAIAEPLALEYLAAGAKLDGHDVMILDLRLHHSDLDNTLRIFRPDIVGITGYSMHVLRNIAICRHVHELLPCTYTAVGGHHATLMPEDFLTDGIDFVICGEGVRPLRALLYSLTATQYPDAIPGIWARSPKVNGRFIYGGDQPDFRIDELPEPDRSLVAADRGAYFVDWMRPIALVRTSVGCPYRCSFCSLWKIMDGHYHGRQQEGIISELRAIHEECIFFVDDEPFVNGQRMASLADAIKASGLRKRYFAYCRMDTLLRQPELMRKWRGIGLERLFVGIEAATEDGLADYNKRLHLTQIERGLKLAKDLGIRIFAGFVVNTNYSRRDFTRLIRFIEHNGIDYPSFTVLTPIPGTAALTSFENVTEMLPNGRPNWDLFDLQHPVTVTNLTREEFIYEYEQLYKVFNPRYVAYREAGAAVDNPCRGSLPAFSDSYN